MTETYTRWDVIEYLNSPADACGYLAACLEEAPGDAALLHLALSDIARAKDAGRIELEFEPGEEGLLQALAESGNLSYATVLAIARTLGLELRIVA